MITPTFEKFRKKLGSVQLEDIKNVIIKYTKGLGNTVELYDRPKGKLLKCYLLSKKVRALIFFEKVGNTFVPIWIGKKENHRGYNITLDDEAYFENILTRIMMDDLACGDYLIYILEE